MKYDKNLQSKPIVYWFKDKHSVILQENLTCRPRVWTIHFVDHFMPSVVLFAVQICLCCIYLIFILEYNTLILLNFIQMSF